MIRPNHKVILCILALAAEWTFGGFATMGARFAAVATVAVVVAMMSIPAPTCLLPFSLGASDDLLPRAEEEAFLQKNLDLTSYRVIGTHNSTHRCSLFGLAFVPPWRFSHGPLADQLNCGIRSLELDVWYNLGTRAWEMQHENLVDCLLSPRTDPSFRKTVQIIRDWSASRNDHFPLQINLDVKGAYYPFLGWCAPFSVGRGFSRAAPYSEAAFAQLKEDILSAFPMHDIHTPAAIIAACLPLVPRAEPRPHLQELVSAAGWGPIGQLKGKALFYLNVYGRVAASADAADGGFFFVRGHSEASGRVYYENCLPVCRQKNYMYRSCGFHPTANQVAIDSFAGIGCSIDVLPGDGGPDERLLP
ncbi:hypothetical protein DIPPA_12805 [Diplonema papillatum]|nr:hypothetical protein DIPPA_12805 [Diplonema papillatum]|eukprot:gene12889-19878_t